MNTFLENWIHYHGHIQSEILYKKRRIEPMKNDYWGKTMWLDFYLILRDDSMGSSWKHVFRLTNDVDVGNKDYGNRCPLIAINKVRKSKVICRNVS